MVQFPSSSTSCSRNPAIVLVTGACHSPSHYQRVLTILENSGFESHCLALPSLNCEDPQTATASKDAAYIRCESLQPLIEDGKEVLLVMHSYGGIPGSAAAKGLSALERRQQGLSGAVIGQVFVTALVVEEGETLLGSIGGEWPEVLKPNNTKGIVTACNALELFYADVSPLAATEAADTLLPHSMTALTTPSGPPSWSEPAYNARRVYIRCIDDKALPLAGQDAFWEKTGLDWITRDIQAGHSPFLSCPETLAMMLIELALNFQESSGLDSEIAEQPAEASKA